MLSSDAALAVTDADDAITFAPVTTQRDSALLLLPGCPLDLRAYAPLTRSIAAKGHLSLIVKVPWRCAASTRHELQLDARVLSADDSAPRSVVDSGRRLARSGSRGSHGRRAADYIRWPGLDGHLASARS